MKILLLGASGCLGGAFVRDWQGQHELVILGRDELDLAKPAQLARQLEGVAMDLVVNCAGLTALEPCEDDPELALTLNREAPRELARICAERKVDFVHFSTDYVLQGDREGLKDEQAETGAPSVYGQSKLAGEQAVLEVYPEAVVARVSWLFGGGRERFAEQILRRALAGEQPEAIADKWSQPTSCAEVVRWSEVILASPKHGGIWHLTHEGAGESWHSYAEKVLKLACERGLLDKVPEVRAMRMEEVTAFRAQRQKHTVMEAGRLKQMGVSVGCWEVAAIASLEGMTLT